MLSRLQNKFGTAGLVVAIVALVAALTGAAFAAGGLTKQQEKQVKKIAKKYAGKPGKPGPAGPAGPAGAKGDKGDKGDTGATGATGPQGIQGKTGPAGKDGSFAEEMVSGTTLRGNWSIASSAAYGLDSVSYLMKYPGTTPPEIVFVRTGGAAECEEFEEPVKAACEADEKAAEDNCPGTAAVPEADPGFVCFYLGEQYGAGPPFPPGNFIFQAGPENNFTKPGQSTLYGATLKLAPAPGGVVLAGGTWAVTAA